MNSESLAAKAATIKLLLFDVDGVMTDGAVVIHGDGTESKRFHIRDGIAMVWASRRLSAATDFARTPSGRPIRDCVRLP